MKLKVKQLSWLILTAISLNSCNDENGGDVPVPGIENSRWSVYILNQGNMQNQIEGGLSVVDLKNKTCGNNVFKNVNGRILGDTPQCGVAYGSKIYIGTYESKTIEVIDRESFKSILQIKLENEENGKTPRSMVAANGKVYISFYEGYVSSLDTVNLKIDASVRVGDNPDIMCLHKDKLYVPNSEGMNYLVGKPYGTTASVLTLSPLAEEKRFTVPMNPTKFMSDGDNLYLLSMGDYMDLESAVYKIKDDIAEKIAPATVAAAGVKKLLIGNNPYVVEGSALRYTIYDGVTGKSHEVEFEEAIAPANVAIDPYTGDYIITSYNKPEGMFADYSSPCRVLIYDTNIQLIQKYQIGVCPSAIFFNE